MAKYYYTARSKEGKLEKGEYEAASQGQVVDWLHSKGLVVVNVEEGRGLDISRMGEVNIGNVPLNEKVVFMRQLATMVGAGLPLTQSLEILATQAQNKAFKRSLAEIVKDVRGGSGLADSMARQKGVFTDITINLVRAGEESGNLEGIFLRLADNMEQKRSFKGKVKGAMIYPVIIIIAIIIVVAVLLVTMVPQMTELYEEFDAQLPLATRLLVWMSDVMINYWWLLISVVVILIVSFISYRRSKAGREMTDELVLVIPVFGKLTVDSQVAEFARTLEMLMKSGIPIVDALNIVADSLGNVVFQDAVRKAAKAVERGIPLAKPISEEEKFPMIVSQMIAVGEETGKVDVILGKLTDYFTEEVNHTVNNLTTLMEPVILLVMGGVIGFIAIAIYLPIFQLGKAMG